MEIEGREGIEEKLESITAEESLLDVFKAAQAIPLRGFNQWVTLVAAFALCAYVIFSAAGPLPAPDYGVLAGQIRGLADTGISFGTGVLGFLLAGFAIFTTLANVEMLERMALKVEARSKLSYLKFNFFPFIAVFVEYLTFVALCFAVKVFGWTNGPISSLIGLFPDYVTVLKATIVSTAFVIYGSFTFYVVMSLKSFIWNTFHVVMTSIRWALEFRERERRIKEGRLVVKP